MKERVAIVLGGAGFIGRHVCRQFADSGYTVYAVGHGAWEAAECKKWGVERWVAADITTTSIQEAAGTDVPSVLVHCGGGGSVSSSYSAPLEDYNRTVLSTASILEYARLAGGRMPRVVLTSSAAVYGDQGDVDLSETAIRAPVSPYGFNKVASEDLCNTYSRFFQVPISIVRLFSVYGEGLCKQLLWDAMSKLSHDQFSFFGTGNEIRDWIHVKDAARLLFLAATVPSQGAFEIFNGANQHELIRNVLIELFRLAGIKELPQFNGMTHVGNPHRLTASCRHARSLLGWQPNVTLEEGLANYVHWYLRERRL
jgi:UDP-glucose 4-epimerase